MSVGGSSISLKDAHFAVQSVVNDYVTDKTFLSALIDEGLLIKDIVRNDDNSTEEVIYLAYERFDDHLTVKFLLDDVKNIENEFKTNGRLKNYFKDEYDFFRHSGIVEALSIQLPEKFGKELYELLPEFNDNHKLLKAFIESLVWRDINAIDLEKIKPFISKNVLRINNSFDLFLEAVISISGVVDHPFNASFLHNWLMKYSLADRDAYWTIQLKHKYSEDSTFRHLIDWAWTITDKSYISDESIELVATSLCWFLTSTNRELRDCSTKGLVSLLENNIPVLIKVIKKFDGVNDPYVYERLFAAAYGCALLSSDDAALKSLAIFINTTIFDTHGEEVYPHILLRDYARGIIEYTQHVCGDLGIDKTKYLPPYKSKFPTVFPTNEELDKKYEVDCEKDKCHLWSQSDILSSMTTEYGRGISRYGDFGRYIFQSALRSWDVNPNQLSNLAVEWIFEKYGYDAELHGEFDSKIGSGRTRTSNSERIGKKYQWIALHEILARVSDNYAIKSNRELKGNETESYRGAWQANVRDIDPSILHRYSESEAEEKTTNKWWLTEQYENWTSSEKEWIHEDNDLPNPEALISVVDKNNEEWLTLEGYPEWAEPETLGKKQWDHGQKRMWYHIRSYIVSKGEFQSLYDWAIKQDFMGRWMPEASDRYQMFDREYYWSTAHQYFNNYYDGGLEQHKIKLGDPSNRKIEVTLTATKYFWQKGNGGSTEDSLDILKPPTFIHNRMG